MKAAAGLGLFDFPFSGARAFWQWVDLCETGGVDSLWQSDRLIGDQPMLECMSTMAALAGATRRIRFGMNVASVALRDPVLLARQCATIDMLSEGRLLPAFGIGSPHSADWKGTGTPTRARGARTDEALDIIAALWRGERVTCNGTFYSCDDAVISPLPVQRRFPLWIGGSSDAAVRRTARIGTGWMGGRETPAEAARVVSAIREAAAAQGRRIPEDHYGVGIYVRVGRADEPVVVAEIERLRGRFPDRDPAHAVVAGGPERILDRVREFVDAGVTKFVLRPVARGDDDFIEQTRRLIERVLPEIGALPVLGAVDG
jgi:probable F420-dependent oxidoreductase